MQVNISTNVRDLGPLGGTPAAGVRIEIAPARAAFGGTVTTTQAFTVTVDAEGDAEWIAQSGDVLRILPRFRGARQFHVLVPAQASVTLSELYLNHQIDPATLEPVGTAPTIQEELARLEGLIETGGGGTDITAVTWGGGLTGTGATPGLNATAVDTAVAGRVADNASATTTAVLGRIATAINAEVTRADSALTTYAATVTAALATKVAETDLVFAAVDGTDGSITLLERGAVTVDDGGEVTITTTTDGSIVVQPAGDYATAANVATAVAGVTKTSLGLGSVDNTADAAKPVSTAQQTALNLKAPLASPAFTGTPTGITKTHVGLSNVDNTSDTAKPVSTAQQTALDAKADKALTINAQTGTTYTAVLADAGKLTTLSNAAAITYTIPPNSSVAFPVGSRLDGATLGAGQATITPGAGVTFFGAAYKSARQGALWTAIKVATDQWIVNGDLSA